MATVAILVSDIEGGVDVQVRSDVPMGAEDSTPALVLAASLVGALLGDEEAKD